MSSYGHHEGQSRMTTNLEHDARDRGLPRSRRLAHWVGGAATVVAKGSLAFGSTLGLFSSTPGGETNTFTAGTVTLTSDATGACTATQLMPGDAANNCTFQATYTGSADAYVGLDVLIRTTAGAGHTAPETPRNGVTVTLTDNQGTPVTYTAPTVATACPGSPPAESVCYALDNLLVKAGVFTSASPAVTFTTNVGMPAATGNGYQGATVLVSLTAHAVQAKNQTLPVGCTVGNTCAPNGSFSWS
jgi:hypothetical protein